MADFAAIDTLNDPQINYTSQKDIKFGSSLQYFLRFFPSTGVISFAGSTGQSYVTFDPEVGNGNGIQIWDSDYSHLYKIGSSDLTGTYVLKLPVITADDFFTSNDSTAVLKNKTLNGIAWRSVAKSADATLASDELIVQVSASGANRTMTLPAAASSTGKIYLIQKSDSSANTVTVDANASETINGALTFVLTTQYQTVMIWCDGTNWFTQPNSTERTGKAVASGNGSTVLFNIAHGLGTTPSNAMISVAKPAIITTYTIDSTNIAVTFASAPASASNNVEIHWRVVA